LEASKADNTKRAYRSDWAHFAGWCAAHGLPALPASPETVALYLSDLAATHKPSTLTRRLAAISVAHQAASQPSPTRSIVVRSTLKGIRRSVGVAAAQKSALRAQHLREIIPQLEGTLQGLRDKALLLIGYAGAFRRSELVALNVDDIAFEPQGARITLRRSKTDQEGQGEMKAIPFGSHKRTCPVKALEAWLSASGITGGPIFRGVNRHGQLQAGRLTDRAVALILKRVAALCGLDPASVGGHSLRAGLITDLYQKGTPEAVIMGISGHRSRTVLGRYRREADAFAFNHIAAVGL
jgi:site-specific recombinase XerD